MNRLEIAHSSHQRDIVTRAILGIAGTLIAVAGTTTLVHAQASPPSTTIGLGVGAGPRYAGAADYHAVPVPILSASHGLFFINGLTVGAGIPIGKQTKAGVIVTAAFGRDDTAEKRLNGIGDVKTTAAYGAFVKWNHGPFGLSAKYLQSAHANYGATLILGGDYTLRAGSRDTLIFGVDTAWANAKSMRTNFGISDEQAANSLSGLSTYATHAGFQRVETSITWNHVINRSWSINGFTTIGHLIGNAAGSPIVERSTSIFTGAGVAYAF